MDKAPCFAFCDATRGGQIHLAEVAVTLADHPRFICEHLVRLRRDYRLLAAPNQMVGGNIRKWIQIRWRIMDRRN